MAFTLPPLPSSQKSATAALATNTTAAAALANIALVIPQTARPTATKGYQPLNKAGTNGIHDYSLAQATPLLFHYEDENDVNLESDITDHPVEDNSAVVDQIAIKPEVVTVKGFIGELNDVLPDFLQPLQDVVNNLVAVNSYEPALSISARQKLVLAQYAYQSAASLKNSAVSAWSSITQGDGNELAEGSGAFTVGATRVQSLQQKMFQQFYGYWNSRTLFNVQTPWAIFTNMAIKSVRANQGSDTRMISSFDVTFKKIRTARTKVTTTDTISVGRTATQSSSLVPLGTSSGVPGSSLGSNITAVV